MLSLVYSLLVSTRTPLAHTPTTLLLLVYYRHQHCPRPPRPRSGKRAKEKPNGDVRLPKQFKECEARRLIGAESVFPARVSACKYISFRACATRCTRSAERCLDASSSGRSTRKRRSTRSLPSPRVEPTRAPRPRHRFALRASGSARAAWPRPTAPPQDVRG